MRALAAATAAELVYADRVLLIAHRGASRQAPENTLPAIAAAGAAGVDLIEVDYRHSSDGAPVVIHDATLDRTTNALDLGYCEECKVERTECADLERLDAGAWFDLRFAGTRLPMLDAAIEAILAPTAGTAFAVLERKSGDAGTLVTMLRRRGWLERVVAIAFDRRFLRGCRSQAPQLLLGLVREGPVTAELVADIARTSPAIAVWRFDDLTNEAIERLHAAGLRVWAWTVDEPSTARRLIADGVDAIITNDPARLTTVVRAAARRAGASGLPSSPGRRRK